MWVGRWAVLLFLVAVPACVSLFDTLGAHDISRIAQIIASSLAAIAIAWRIAIRRGDEGRSASAALASCAAVLVALLSVWHAPDSTAAMRELALCFGIICIAAVIARTCRKAQFDVLAIVVTVAALLNAGLVLMIMASAVGRSEPLDLFTVVPGYDNPRFLNHVQTVMLPLLAVATSQSFRQGEFARLARVAMALNFALLFFTQGRATGLALLGASLLALLLFGRSAVPLLRDLAIGAAIGLAIHLVLFVWAPSVLSTSPEPWRAVADTRSYAERLKLWHLAVDYLKREPWLGIGPMHYAHYLNPTAAHPHNIYLQIASEWGFPMFLGLLTWFAWAAWRMERAIAATNDTEQAAMGLALFFAVVAASIDGMLSGNFVMPVSQVWIAFTAGWAIAWTRLNSRSTAAPGGAHWQRSVGAACCLLALASQVWLWWSIAPEITNLNLYLENINVTFSNSAPPAARFWSTGWF